MKSFSQQLLKKWPKQFRETLELEIWLKIKHTTETVRQRNFSETAVQIFIYIYSCVHLNIQRKFCFDYFMIECGSKWATLYYLCKLSEAGLVHEFK